MSILSVDNISPIGSGTSVTINSAATLVLNNVNSTGVATATTFVGALTGTASGNPTMSSGANNRVMTATGTNALTGESNLTFDGSTLTVNGGSTDTPLLLDTTNNNGSHLRFRKDGSNKHFFGCGGGFGLGDIDDLSLRTVDNIIFGVGTSEKVRITSSGYVGINQSSPQTRLHINQDWVASYGSISAEGSNNALVGLGLRSSGTYRAALIWRDGSSGDYLELATQSTSNPILFKPNNTERVRVQDGGLKLNGGSYIMEVTGGSGAPNNANRQMDQRRWMWYGTSSSTHTVARVAKASSGQPGDGDSKLAAWIVTYTARSMYGFNSDGGYSVMKMRTGRFDYDDNTVRFSTEQDTLGTGGGSQNPTIVFTDEGSGVVRISITNPSSTHSFGEINLMTYDCRITLPSG